jgi:nucleoid-associated protein YejK
MPQFVFSVTHTLYHRTRDKIYRLHECMPWTEINQEELVKDLHRFHGTGEKYMIVYDYQMMNKRDYWDANPEKISKDELDFWYMYGLLNEEQYLHFHNLRAL